MSDLLDMLSAIQVKDQQVANRATRLPEMFAAKWMCEDAGRGAEPTDEALAEAFKHCVAPARPHWYPAIRAAIETTEGQ